MLPGGGASENRNLIQHEPMNIKQPDCRQLSRLFRRILLAAGPVLLALVANAQPVTYQAVRTNWVQRAVTNIVVVTEPKLYVVNEYHTNTVPRFITNTVEMERTVWEEHYVTNVFRRIFTNPVPKTVTNFFVENQYWTNVVPIYRTNWVNTYVTNWLTLTETNLVVLDVVQTNLVLNYRTNRSTVTVTNWSLVFLTKTNWVGGERTNFTTINMPAPVSDAAADSLVDQDAASPTAVTSPGVLPKDFMLAWRRTGAERIEIALQSAPATTAVSRIPVSEWRVERTDSTVLLMGHDDLFTGDLPNGDYIVTAKYDPQNGSPALTLGGTIKVTAGAGMHQIRAAPVDRQH
jgi:hypothetical protein